MDHEHSNEDKDEDLEKRQMDNNDFERIQEIQAKIADQEELDKQKQLSKSLEENIKAYLPKDGEKENLECKDGVSNISHIKNDEEIEEEQHNSENEQEISEIEDVEIDEEMEDEENFQKSTRVFGIFVLCSIAMFVLPFLSFFGTKYILKDVFNIDGYANTVWSVIVAVVTVNLIIVVYAYKAFHEESKELQLQIQNKKKIK